MRLQRSGLTISRVAKIDPGGVQKHLRFYSGLWSFKAWLTKSYFFLSFFKDFIYFTFRQKEREGEREGEKHQCVVASHVPPTGHLACKPGMCPDWESNQEPFGSQVSTQSSEPHQPGPQSYFITFKFNSLGFPGNYTSSFDIKFFKGIQKLCKVNTTDLWQINDCGWRDH